MEIKINNYTIKSDSQNNLWVMETVPYTDKDGTEKTTEVKVAGYCGNFKQLLESFIINKSNRSDATEVIGVITELKIIQNNAIEIAKAYFESRKQGQ
jgi:hypothetical protein